MGEWQRIETAPKDGTEFLAVDETGNMWVVRSRYENFAKLEPPGYGWQEKGVDGGVADDAYSHWMPLPKPPTP